MRAERCFHVTVVVEDYPVYHSMIRGCCSNVCSSMGLDSLQTRGVNFFFQDSSRTSEFFLRGNGGEYPMGRIHEDVRSKHLFLVRCTVSNRT